MLNTIFEDDKMESDISDSCKELVFQRFNGKRSQTSLTRSKSSFYLYISARFIFTSFSFSITAL